MRKKLIVGLCFLSLFCISIVSGQEGPKFYLLNNKAYFTHLKKSETYEGKVKKLVKKLSPKNINDVQVVVPEEIAETELSPKHDEKLWLFVDSKLYGVTEPTTFTANYSLYDGEGGGPVFGINFQIDAQKLFPLYRDKTKNNPGVFVSVPAGTQVQLDPSENHVRKISLREIDEILKALFKLKKPSNFICGGGDDWLGNYSIVNSLSFDKENVAILKVCSTMQNYNCCQTVLRTGEKVKVLPNYFLEQTFQVMGSNYVVFDTGSDGYCGKEIWRVDDKNIDKVVSDGFGCD